MHFAQVVSFEDIDVQPLAHPGRNVQGRVKRGSRLHDCVARIGTWVFHTPQQLAVLGVDIQADRGGPPLAWA
jgi:hypothetical protein